MICKKIVVLRKSCVRKTYPDCWFMKNGAKTWEDVGKILIKFVKIFLVINCKNLPLDVFGLFHQIHQITTLLTKLLTFWKSASPSLERSLFAAVCHRCEFGFCLGLSWCVLFEYLWSTAANKSPDCYIKTVICGLLFNSCFNITIYWQYWHWSLFIAYFIIAL